MISSDPVGDWVKFADLPQTIGEAKKLRRRLLKLGFKATNIYTLTDTTPKDIINYKMKIKEKLLDNTRNGKSTFFFLYAGCHGMQKNFTHIVLNTEQGDAIYNLERYMIIIFAEIKDLFIYRMFDICERERERNVRNRLEIVLY